MLFLFGVICIKPSHDRFNLNGEWLPQASIGPLIQRAHFIGCTGKG